MPTDEWSLKNTEPTPTSLASRRASLDRFLPELLVNVLERRYLTGVRAGAWRIEPGEDDRALPLFRQVVALGRPTHVGDALRAMPHVLNACHAPGHALGLLLHGDGRRHRLYVGGRRLIGAGGGSTEDYLCQQESVLKAYYPGLELGPVARLDGGEMPEAARFLQTAPALAAVTGVPSGRGGRFPLETQTLDRLVRAVGNQSYALHVVAEPLDSWLVEQAIDACRHLRSEVHAHVRRTLTRATGGSESESVQETTERAEWIDELPALLSGVALFLHLAGLPAAGLGMTATTFASNLRGSWRREPSRQTTQGRNWNDSATVETVDANAEACEQLLQEHLQRLQGGRGSGWWRVAVYAAGESDAALQGVCGALRGLCSGDHTSLDPIRCLALPPHVLRQPLARGQVLHLRPDDGKIGHPLGQAYDALATCVNSDELSVLVNLPHDELPGLPMRHFASFGLTAPPATSDSIELGHLEDAAARAIGPVSIPATTLNRHVFVTGMTGYGKTNSCMRLLLESHEKLGVPFLVIEPAKAEYGRLARIPALRGRLRVYQIGRASGLPLRLNPLTPLPGTPLGRHIDLLKAVFNASFPMPAGLPYVLEEAILDVYRERGWSIYTSENNQLGPRSGLEERSALTPCLEDVHDQVDVVLNRKKYGQEIHQNLGAALRSRLRSLMVGNKGLVLNSRRSTPPEDLFAGPTVIQLQDLGDDDEKAFVMALLFVRLYEYAEARQRGRPTENRERLQHLTLIEEAHRLLRAPQGTSSPESGNPQAKAVTMFTDMLAEMRAYGEGFIIADQIPTKLAPETLKNSSLKIVHRLAAPDDRLAAGHCMNLTEPQMRHLNNLAPGQAVVHDEGIGAAVLTQVHRTIDWMDDVASADPASEAARELSAAERMYLLRHGGCRSCPDPCRFFHHLSESTAPPAAAAELRDWFEAVLFHDAEHAWSRWRRWTNAMRAPVEGDEASEGILFCAAAQAADEWVGTLLLDRLRAIGASTLAPADRLRRAVATRALGELILAWLRPTHELDDGGRARFADVQRRLRGGLEQGPRDAPGCASCPARCRMLPYLAGIDLARLPGQLTSTLAGPMSVAERADQLERKLHVIEQNIPLLRKNQDLPTAPDHWRYCLLVNLELPPAAAAGRDELLAWLRRVERAGAPSDPPRPNVPT